jgi:hypothetical protein
MLMRGNIPPTTISTPLITSDRKPTQLTTCHSRRGRTGRERPDVESNVDEGCPRLQATTDRAACVAAPQQHQSPPPATRHSPQGAVPRHGEGDQRRRRTVAQRHTAGCGPRPGPAPAAARRSPTRHVPRQQQEAGGNEDILSSATGPSTTRCSKDVTTHQHLPGARPGSPCPVPACSGQPLPGERRFSSALGNSRIFTVPLDLRILSATRIFRLFSDVCCGSYGSSVISWVAWHAGNFQLRL